MRPWKLAARGSLVGRMSNVAQSSDEPDRNVGSDAMSTGASRADMGGGVVAGDGRLVLISGPSVIHSRDQVMEVAGALQTICDRLDVGLVFRASLASTGSGAAEALRGLGFDAGLAILADVRQQLDLPVLTDVAEARLVAEVAQVVDVIQVTASLSRRNELLEAASTVGCAVNIRKGQFLPPEDTSFAVQRVRALGGSAVTLTERGTTYGYRDLVVDFRSLAILRRFAPVFFDATHSVKVSGAGGGTAGGRAEFVAPLARAAVAFGVDGLLLETHPDPDDALGGARGAVPLAEMEELIAQCVGLHPQDGRSPQVSRLSGG